MDRDFGILRIAMLATALSLPVVVAAQAPPKTAQPVVPKGDLTSSISTPAATTAPPSGRGARCRRKSPTGAT